MLFIKVENCYTRDRLPDIYTSIHKEREIVREREREVPAIPPISPKCRKSLHGIHTPLSGAQVTNVHSSLLLIYYRAYTAMILCRNDSILFQESQHQAADSSLERVNFYNIHVYYVYKCLIHTQKKVHSKKPSLCPFFLLLSVLRFREVLRERSLRHQRVESVTCTCEIYIYRQKCLRCKQLFCTVSGLHYDFFTGAPV